MSRTSAKKLASTQINDFSSIEILEAYELYAVFYQDQPINIKHKYWNISGEINKYSRSMFTTRKPTENLANKLNDYFMCSDFTARKVL